MLSSANTLYVGGGVGWGSHCKVHNTMEKLTTVQVLVSS